MHACRLHAVLAQDAAFAQCRGEPGASASVAEAETVAMRSAMTRTFAVSCPMLPHGGVMFVQLALLRNACLLDRMRCMRHAGGGW